MFCLTLMLNVFKFLCIFLDCNFIDITVIDESHNGANENSKHT